MNIKAEELLPWEIANWLPLTRTCGQIGFRKNGTQLDIWIRIDGRPRWFSVNQDELTKFLEPNPDKMFGGHGDQIVLAAESDGNAEEC